MSIATWKKEFYPILAEKCSRTKALDHSIRKWSGTTRDALRRHGVKKNNGYLIDARGNDFIFGWETCALCLRFENCLTDREPANTCPIKLVTGKECFSQCDSWMNDNDSRPMLALLRKVKREMAKRGKK